MLTPTTDMKGHIMRKPANSGGHNARMGKKHAKAKKTRIRYYHGGISGLMPGERLKAPSETGFSLRNGYARFDDRKIFVTTSEDLARGYAYGFARLAPTKIPRYHGPALGSLYEVKVTGPKEVDEDYLELAHEHDGPISFAVKMLAPEIIRVIDIVGPNPTEEYKLFAPFQTWESPDGKIYPMWDENGYVMPTPADAKRGFTAATYERQLKLGPYPGRDALKDAKILIED